MVMKFGGTSVADIERIRNVAQHVKREVGAGHEVAVVVSAMAGTTNRLVEWCREAAVLHDAREYDTVVAAGEQVTSGLLAIALQGIGVPARSWQGWQIPIATTDAHGLARILEVNGAELVRRFNALGHKLNALTRQGRWNEMAKEVPDDVAHLFAAVGRHDEIVGAIGRRFGGLADALTLRGDGVGEVPPDLVQDIRRVPHQYRGLPR